MKQKKNSKNKMKKKTALISKEVIIDYKKDKFNKIISLILMILVIFQPLMDALTYLQIRYSFNFLSISSIIRTITLCLIILYLLFTKDKRKEIWFLLIYFIAYLGIQSLILNNDFSNSLNSILTIFYLPSIIIFLNKVNIDKKYFNLKIIMFTYLIYLNLIIVPYLFKYGNYANNFYEGKNGFYGLFYGGNEISNILISIF